MLLGTRILIALSQEWWVQWDLFKLLSLSSVSAIAYIRSSVVWIETANKPCILLTVRLISYKFSIICNQFGCSVCQTGRMVLPSIYQSYLKTRWSVWCQPNDPLPPNASSFGIVIRGIWLQIVVHEVVSPFSIHHWQSSSRCSHSGFCTPLQIFSLQRWMLAYDAVGELRGRAADSSPDVLAISETLGSGCQGGLRRVRVL